MDIALVNTNRISPPIAPVGLEYIAETLRANGFNTAVLDLCWEADPYEAVSRFFSESHYGLCGVTLRNTDDCSYSSSHSFMPFFYETVDRIRRSTDAMLVLGGAGLSVFPEKILGKSCADAAVRGEGEIPFLELALAVEENRSFEHVPGLIYKYEDGIRLNSRGKPSLDRLPVFRRDTVDIPRYFREGGQIGFETKRGCTSACIYCADPVSKGRTVRTRNPVHVADELEYLLGQGVNYFHTCDSEFNIPSEHACAVCRELISRGLGEKLNWYTYCSPVPFTGEVAFLMARAGCRGINFGADSADAEMLKILNRNYIPEDIDSAVRLCRENGISVMLDLLFGSPGESERSIRNTIQRVRQISPDVTGIAAGIRIYPGTGIAMMTETPALGRGLTGGDGLDDPLFFIEPELGEDLFEIIDREIDGDPDFLFMNPAKPESSYNYAGNEILERAIAGGARGAYWDILRKLRGV